MNHDWQPEPGLEQSPMTPMRCSRCRVVRIHVKFGTVNGYYRYTKPNADLGLTLAFYKTMPACVEEKVQDARAT